VNVRHVRQKDGWGCGVAALAMVTGHEYDAIREYFIGLGKSFEGEAGGLHELDLEQYLADHRFAAAKKYRWYGANVQRPSWPVPPFAEMHICSVRNPGGWHFIVLLADGRVLDPLDEQVKALAAWPEVGYVMGVFDVREQR
jgi:hypothetical protein